jgi:DNA-binding HxlR family transcriptional regulator
VTPGQRAVLAALTDGPKYSSNLEKLLGKPQHSRLRALEDRGLIRRIQGRRTHNAAAEWELTHAGRSALNLTG